MTNKEKQALEEKAREAFQAINNEEYQCTLAESQMNEHLFNEVKCRYEVAANAFVQGVLWHERHLEAEKNKICLKPMNKLPQQE